MKKNNGIKIVAFFALFAIIIGVLGTGLLIIFDNSTNENINNNNQLDKEKLQDILNQIKINSGEIETSTGLDININ